jgi:hypothetical protein
MVKTRTGVARGLVVLGVLTVGGLLLGAQPASAGTITGACMATRFGSNLNCTANDVSVAQALSVSPAECTEGETFDLTATFQVNTTSTQRYDIGLYFSIDGDGNGDGALTGSCSLSTLPTAPVPPNENYDGDFCGDTSSAHSPRFVTLTLPGVACADPDGDGFLNLPNCTSWRNNSGDLCATEADAFPGTKSKCKCDRNFEIPIRVTAGAITVEKAALNSVEEPGGTVDYEVTVTNVGDAQVTLSTIVDDPDNDANTNNSVTYQAADACLDTILAPDESTTCTFSHDVSGNANEAVTDQACANGTDSHNTSVSDCDTATVTIGNVNPSATLDKSPQSTVCATVRYLVVVTNTDPAEAISLESLCDDKFGTVAGSGCAAGSEGAIAGTTCSAPQSIAIGESYNCTFDAVVCSGDHANTVTATGSDDDGNPFTASGQATVVDPPPFP